MKVIRDYLETLFMNLPQTAAVQKAKEDLTAIMEDHYQELLAEGKNEHEAIGTVISEFGSIDELLQELDVDPEVTATEQATYFNQGEPVDLAEMQDYWQEVRRFALKMATGVGSLFCALAFAVFTSNYGSGLGAFLLMLSGIVGICLFVFGGLNYAKAAKEIRHRTLTPEARAAQQELVRRYQTSFTWSLVLGIGAGLFSVIMPTLFYSTFGGMLFFAFLGLGGFLVIYGSIVYGLYRKGGNSHFFSSDKEQSWSSLREFR